MPLRAGDLVGTALNASTQAAQKCKKNPNTRTCQVTYLQKSMSVLYIFVYFAVSIFLISSTDY